jgi:hypothetical protein
VRYFDITSSNVQANEVKISIGLFLKASVMSFVTLTRILRGGSSPPSILPVNAIQDVPPAPRCRCREKEQVYS